MGVATGWTVSGTAGVWYPNPGPVGGFNTAVPEGNQILYAGYTSAGDVSQTLAATVQANTTYTLSFFLGQRNDGVSISTYSVALEANGTTVLAIDTTGSPAPGTFVPRTITFNSGANPATLGQSLGIYIHGSGSANASQAQFDNFKLDQAQIPEPATFVLIGGGIIGIMLSRRRLPKQN